MSIDAVIYLFLIVAGLGLLALLIRSIVEFSMRHYVRGALVLGAVGIWICAAYMGMIWLAFGHYCEGEGCGEETMVPVLGYTFMGLAVSAMAIYPPYRAWRRKRAQSRPH